MEQTSQSLCTQKQPNIAEVNLTPGDNNTAEESNRYSEDKLVDTTYHPIMKDDVKHMSIQAQESPHNSTRQTGEWQHRKEKRESHKHRHEDRTDWAETLLSPLMTKYSYQHRREARNGAKNYEQKENCWHILNEDEAKQPGNATEIITAT